MCVPLVEIRGIRLSLRAWVACLVLITACVGRAEPAPDALSAFLDDLVAGRLDTAYGRTQLSELGAFTQGGALSREHFEAFYRSDPVRSFDIVEVVRLDRRSPDRLGEQGTPEWEVAVRLEHASGPVEASFGVVGEVLAQVTVVPIALDLVVAAGVTPDIRLDGIPVDVSSSQVGPAGDRWRIVILEGRHRVEVGDVNIRFLVEPLTVIEGPASAEGDPSSPSPQTLRIAA